MTDITTDRTEQGLSHDGIRRRRQRRVARWHIGATNELSEMINIRQSQSVWLIFQVSGDFADGGDIFRFQAICNTHLIQVSIAGKREDGRILILPAKLAYSSLSRRLQNGNLNRLAMNHSIALSRL